MKTVNPAGEDKGNGFSQIFILVGLLLIISLACNLPAGRLLFGHQNPNKPTSQTSGQTGGKRPDESPKAPPSTTTPAPDTPTSSLTPTDTLVPTITLTPTPYVFISGNTNCRFGPGTIYDLLHTYPAGEEALLLGKNAAEDFWYTSDKFGINPDCWLWGKFATPVGDTSALPIFTPPPTPTPYLDFAVNFEASDCGAGSCGFWFKVDNTGVMPIESVRVYVENTVTSANSTYTSNLFMTGIMGSDIADVPISGSGYTRSNLIPNPSGDKVNASIKGCSINGLNGICLTKNLVINP